MIPKKDDHPVVRYMKKRRLYKIIYAIIATILYIYFIR